MNIAPKSKLAWALWSAGIVLLVGLWAIGAATLTVGPDLNLYDYTSIQAAIDAAVDGDTIWIANGTYTETLDISKNITLEGESETGVVIDTSSFNDYGLYAAGDYVIVLKNFTLIGPPSPAYGYGIKISGENADVIIHNVMVKNSGRSGIDLNGIARGELKNITLLDNGGVGLALTDSSNVTVDGITTSGNAWAGMAVYTSGVYYTGGSDNITLTGTNSFGEVTGLYTETANNYPITNLHIPLSDFAYTVSSNVHPNVIGYYPDLTTAVAVAVAGDPNNAFINDRSTGDFVVVPGLKIQSAIDAAETGDTVRVLAGDYGEQVFIGKDMVLVGTVGASVKYPGSVAVTIPESTHQFYPIIFVYGGTMDASHAVSGDGVVSADVRDLDIDGQNSAPAHYFTGILLRNVNGEISGNIIHSLFDSDGEGDGPQTFGILVYGNSTVDILNNIISDFSRGGIGIMGDAGSAPDPTAHVEGNVVTGNGLEAGTGWWAENGIQIGYGATGEIVGNTVTDCRVNNPSWASSGILVVDTNDVAVTDNYVANNDIGIGVVDFPGALYGSPWDASEVEDVLVEGNTLAGNSWALDIANGVTDVMVLYNVFSDNIWDAIDVYDYGIWYPGFGIPAPTGVVIHYNSITGSGGDGLWVGDTVTDLVDATLNWWGSPEGPTVDLDADGTPEYTGGGDSITGVAAFSPWLAVAPDGDPTAPGVQITGPMLIIVDDIGPAPSAGYLNAAIQGANELPFADTIEVRHGTYDASEPITDPVTIVSEEGSASHTTLTGDMTFNSADILLGRMRRGFTVTGNITVNAGVDATTIHINWNDILGMVINQGEGILDATYNWWGDRQPYDAVEGPVRVYPYLPRPSDEVIAFMDEHGLTADEAVLVLQLLNRGLSDWLAFTVLKLMHTYGLTEREAAQILRDYGLGRVRRAMRRARDYKEFVRLLVGFSSEPAGGAAGLLDQTVAGGAGAYQGLSIQAVYTIGTPIGIAFSLTDYVGEPVTDAVCTLTVARLAEDGKQIVLSFHRIPYNPETGLYELTLPTEGLEPGHYLLYFGFGDGTSEQVLTQLVE